MEEQIAELKKIVEDNKEHMLAEIKKLRQCQDEFRDQIKEIRKSGGVLGENLKSMNEYLSNITEVVNGHTEKIVANSTITQNIADLKRDFSIYEDTFQTFDAKLEKLTGKLSNLESRLDAEQKPAPTWRLVDSENLDAYIEKFNTVRRETSATEVPRGVFSESLGNFLELGENEPPQIEMPESPEESQDVKVSKTVDEAGNLIVVTELYERKPVVTCKRVYKKM